MAEIVSKPASPEYRETWERVFRKKRKCPGCEATRNLLGTQQAVMLDSRFRLPDHLLDCRAREPACMPGGMKVHTYDPER